MRRKVEPVVKRNKGDRIEVKKFAFFHTLTTENILVWWEFYIEVQELRVHPIHRFLLHWVQVEDRHICRPEHRPWRPAGGYSAIEYPSECMCGKEVPTVWAR